MHACVCVCVRACACACVFVCVSLQIIGDRNIHDLKMTYTVQTFTRSLKKNQYKVNNVL